MAAVQTTLPMFGAEKTVFWREASTGINRFSYFIGKNLASVPLLLASPAVFLIFFYTFSQPRGLFKYVR